MASPDATQPADSVRIDAGDPYLWRVGDIAVLTTLRVTDKADDVRVTMTLQLDGGEDEHPAVRRTAVLSLTPWSLNWDKGESLPEPLREDHLTALLTKHREEVSWRAGKMLHARDRELWAEQDLSGFQPRVLASYRTLFPADFDLVRYLDGKAYYLEDFHCIEPNCSCSIVTLNVIALDDDGDGHHEIGNASIELLSPRLKPTGSKAAVAVVRKVMQDKIMQKRVARRYAECRRIAPALAVKMGRVPKTVQNDSRRVGRNDPCPCGSGKKFKKCCLNK